MATVSEQVKEVLKVTGTRMQDPPATILRGCALRDVIDQIDTLPEFAQVPVARAYAALYQMYEDKLYQEKRDDDNWSYQNNLVLSAFGYPRRWHVFIQQFDRPHDYILCNVVPFGTCLDTFFSEVEKSEKSRDDYQAPAEIGNIRMKDFYKVRLVSDLHVSNDRFGYCRQLVYEEVFKE